MIIEQKMDKYKNKYRIASARAQWWDYGWNGAYFITICTANREHFFGEVEGGKMNLSAIGHFVNSCWYEIPKHFPFVELGDFVVMPNHIHGIVIIDKPFDGRNVETQNFASLPAICTPPTTYGSKPKNQFGPQSKNLASIIRGYKIGVTKNARNIHSYFTWQSRFHDHIIRNDAEYQRISDYIINNPTNWQDDKFYTT
jgi:REP element-mobilizing transposase RayT